VQPGDEILVPTFTFAATANVATYLGARPVLVDSDRSTWTMDPELVEEELAERAKKGKLPKAVVAVDLYGQCADYHRLTAVCDRYGIPVLEDAAEAMGATYMGGAAGSFGVAGVFSFNGNKIITTSGGGMLVSDDPALVERARYLATQAREPVVHYEHREVGFNYRMSNLLAAIGRAQLRGLDQKIANRRWVNESYRRGLKGLPGLQFMPVAPYGEPNWWLTCILVDAEEFGADREQLRLALEEIDVESRPTWKPLHLQPAFADAERVGGDVSAAVFEQGLCLPSGSNLCERDLQRVVETVAGLCRS